MKKGTVFTLLLVSMVTSHSYIRWRIWHWLWRESQVLPRLKAKSKKKQIHNNPLGFLGIFDWIHVSTYTAFNHCAILSSYHTSYWLFYADTLHHLCCGVNVTILALCRRA